DADALRYRGAERERCFQIFNELGFKTLVAEFAPTAGTIDKTYRIVNTPEALAALVSRLGASSRIALRILPDRPSAMTASIVGLAFSTASRDADYVPTGHRSLGGASSM